MLAKKVLISGSSGLVGRELCIFLKKKGYAIFFLKRFKTTDINCVYWDPYSESNDIHDFENFDVMIHLSGENVGRGRWSKKKKKRIFNSRAQPTQNLCNILKRLKKPPKVFITASAVGFYGDCGETTVNEWTSPRSNSFLSSVCRSWEKPTKNLEAHGIRVVNIRLGTVFSTRGGALKQLAQIFNLGLGSVLGTGKQFMSWIALEDVVQSINHIIQQVHIKGPVNLVAPNPVTNKVFSKELASSLHRFLLPPIPRWVVILIFGQKGVEIFLTSSKVESCVLKKSGYNFIYPSISEFFKSTFDT